MENEIYISNLTLKARYGFSILLYVRTEDLLKKDPPTLMYNLMMKTVYISNLQKILKMAPFKEVNPFDENLQNCYKNQVYSLIPKEKIFNSIATFRSKFNQN